MFAKYSSEKFPLAIIYHVLKFKESPDQDLNEIIGNSSKIFPVAKPELGFFKNQYNDSAYNIFLKDLKKKNKKERASIFKKNKDVCRLYSVQSVIGICNDLSV